MTVHNKADLLRDTNEAELFKLPPFIAAINKDIKAECQSWRSFDGKEKDSKIPVRVKTIWWNDIAILEDPLKCHMEHLLDSIKKEC